MPSIEVNIDAWLTRLLPLESWVFWVELTAIVVSTAIAVLAGWIARRTPSKKDGIGDRLRSWPVGFVVATVAMWGSYLGFSLLAPEGGVLRLGALGATFALIVAVTFRTIGRTALGWLAVGSAAVFIALEALGLAESTIAALDERGILLGSVKVTAWFVIKAIVIVVGVLWSTQRIGDVIEASLKGEQVLSGSGRVLVGKLIRAALLVVAIILALGFLGVNVATLAVLSGAVGLGLGFGLQKVVSNYMAGLILLMDKSIKPGDVIEVEFGEGRIRGEVTQLAGRFTAITLRTGTETLIPNEVLISSPVSNWSHTSRNVQIRMPVHVAYSTDVEKAIALCVDAALAAPRVLGSPKPVCLILGFGDSAVELDVRFWIADAEQGVRNVSSGVYLEIWKRFHESGIEIPFPQRDIHIRSSFQSSPPGSEDQP